MWVGGHGVTRSNQMRKCMQKHLENCKATNRCGASIIFIKLKSTVKTIKSYVISEAYAGLYSFPELEGLSVRDSLIDLWIRSDDLVW